MSFAVRDRTLAQGAAPVLGRIASIGAWVGGWIGRAADAYAAAAMYTQLSGLSDAELHRRGLSRASLAHDIAGHCSRTEDEHKPA
jgi:hypothetical protein